MQGEQLERVFRENMRNRRLELNLTQTDVAELVGIPQPHISSMERGVFAPTITTIARIAEALRCTPSALLSAENLQLVAAAENS